MVRHTRSKTALVVFLFLTLSVAARAAVQGEYLGHQFRVESVLSGLGVPWGIAFLPNSSLLITERSGSIKHYDLTKGELQSIAGAPKVFASGQGGLLDVALSPDYANDRRIYFTYSKAVRGEGVTVLASAILVGNVLTNWQELLVTESRTDTGRHFGSRIAFDQDGHLFFSVGDRGVRENAQNLGNHAGSMIRLRLDGSVPKDNPFIGTKGALPEIWSYGHRNPQGLAYDRVKKRLWAIEHGPRGGDEINLVRMGRNYGWPVISYGKEYWGPISVGEGTHREGMEQPVKYYDPSIAPGSLMFYQGQAFPKWQGRLFAGALKLRHLNVIELDDQARAVSESRLLEDMEERIRALIEDPRGLIYFSTDSGSIYLIRPI